MPTLRQKLGKTVRRLRTDAGYSQEGFADACEVHRTYMGSVERGETNISLDKLETIARTLGIPLSRLFSETEQMR